MLSLFSRQTNIISFTRPKFLLPTSSTSSLLTSRSFATFKLPRDPERPVRPTTPFFAYLQDYRKSSPPSTNNKTLVKDAALKWKSLDPSNKASYESAYEEKKKVYQRAFDEYRTSGKLDSWKRDPLKPKKPLTGFMRYVQEYRKSDEGKSYAKPTEMTKAAAAKYKQLEASEKARYDQLYKQEKVGYDKAISEYKSSGKELAFKKKTGRLELEQKEEKKKMMLLAKTALAKKKLSDKRKNLVMKQKKSLLQKKKKLQAAKLMKARKEKAMKMKKIAKEKEGQLKKKAMKAKETLRKIEKMQKDLKKMLLKAGKEVKK